MMGSETGGVVEFCTNCGAPIGAEQRFCTVCGHQVRGLSSLVAAPAMSALPDADANARVVLGLSHEAPRQRRWTVLVRAFLLIPLVVWLLLVSLVAFFVLVAAWFSALFVARVPRGMQRFLTDVLRYNAKVGAYEALLIGRWPGFSLRSRAGEEVSLEIDAVQLRRTAVFFRFVLAVPALVVLGLLKIGSHLMTIIMWFWLLVAGRAPQALHEARGQSWRFSVRATAYYSLLTPTQPFAGFFGDESATRSLTRALSTTDGSVHAGGDDAATGADAYSPRLSTTWPLSTWGKIFFIVTLLIGAYFQVQPGVTRYPSAYVLDVSVGPRIVAALNTQVTSNFATYFASASLCSQENTNDEVQQRNCLLVAASSLYVALDADYRGMKAGSSLAVRGHVEYLAYLDQLALIVAGVQNIESANTVNQVNALVDQIYPSEFDVLQTRYRALHHAI